MLACLPVRLHQPPPSPPHPSSSRIILAAAPLAPVVRSGGSLARLSGLSPGCLVAANRTGAHLGGLAPIPLLKTYTRRSRFARSGIRDQLEPRLGTNQNESPAARVRYKLAKLVFLLTNFVNTFLNRKYVTEVDLRLSEWERSGGGGECCRSRRASFLRRCKQTTRTLWNGNDGSSLSCRSRVQDAKLAKAACELPVVGQAATVNTTIASLGRLHSLYSFSRRFL